MTDTTPRIHAVTPAMLQAGNAVTLGDRDSGPITLTWDELTRIYCAMRDAELAASHADAAAPAVQAVAPQVALPVTLADVLDALNCFNRPKPNEDDGPWVEGHYIRVDHLPAFINIIAKAWFSAAPVAQPLTPLTDEQIATIASTPCAVVGSYVHAFARAVERAHGITAAGQEGGAA
jgi:hypothetical protein